MTAVDKILPHSAVKTLVPPLGNDVSIDIVTSSLAASQQKKVLQPTPLASTDPLTTPYSDCFSWACVEDELPFPKNGPLYAVVFRSVRKSTADTRELYLADEAAHQEALLAGGLLNYWYGTLNDRRECLATCLWESRDAARAALSRPAHRKAMALTSAMYESYSLERYWIWKGEKGERQEKGDERENRENGGKWGKGKSGDGRGTTLLFEKIEN